MRAQLRNLPQLLSLTQWNERCVFPVSDLNENLLLNVFDHEAVGSDRSLGTKQIPISDLTVVRAVSSIATRTLRRRAH